MSNREEDMKKEADTRRLGFDRDKLSGLPGSFSIPPCWCRVGQIRTLWRDSPKYLSLFLSLSIYLSIFISLSLPSSLLISTTLNVYMLVHVAIDISVTKVPTRTRGEVENPVTASRDTQSEGHKCITVTK